MKHNNIIPNEHFKKDWQNRVRTWLNQPARKERRRRARAAKAARVFPRPTGLVRPAVRCPSQRYNIRIREGRGFTLEELKAVGISRHHANSIGISVDHRRRNKSEQSFQRNVKRLNEYKNMLVVYPKNAKAAVKKDQAAYSELAKAQQHKGKVLPVSSGLEKNTCVARKITEEEKKDSAYHTLRLARSDARLVGKRAARKAAAAANAKSSGGRRR